MKALGRNILIGILCVVILLVLAIGVYGNVFEKKSGLIKVAEDVNRAEITYDGMVYTVEGEKAEQLAEFFRNLEVALYDVGTEDEASGMIIQFFINETESDKLCVADQETLIDYSDDEGDAIIDIYKAESDLEGYLLKFIEEIKE